MLLEPLGYKKGSSVPLKGSKTVDFDGSYLRVQLTAKDGDGHPVSCWVVLRNVGPGDAVHGTTGFAGGPVASV
jgi:hypothetical protein